MDLAHKENGGQIVMSTCSDSRYPPDNMLDGAENTKWVTTGMFPQEFILDLGCLSNVTQIGTISRNSELCPRKTTTLPNANWQLPANVTCCLTRNLAKIAILDPQVLYMVLLHLTKILILLPNVSCSVRRLTIESTTAHEPKNFTTVLDAGAQDYQ